MIVVLFLAPRCSFPFGATLWSPVSTHIQPPVNLPYEHRIARIPRHDTDPTMWDEKNLRTGMTWLKQVSAIGRFRRPSALEFSGLQRGLTMIFSSAPFSARGLGWIVFILANLQMLNFWPMSLLSSTHVSWHLIFQLILSDNYFSQRTPTHTCFIPACHLAAHSCLPRKN